MDRKTDADNDVYQSVKIKLLEDKIKELERRNEYLSYELAYSQKGRRMLWVAIIQLIVIGGTIIIILISLSN
jgi:hypothetical protein